MPAKSKQQQKAAGAALSAKRGQTKKSSLRGASKGMYESMSEPKLEEMASVKRKKLPKRASSKSSGGKSSRSRSTGSRSSSKSGGSKSKGRSSGSRSKTKSSGGRKSAKGK